MLPIRNTNSHFITLERHQERGALEGKAVCSEPLKASQTLSTHETNRQFTNPRFLRVISQCECQVKVLQSWALRAGETKEHMYIQFMYIHTPTKLALGDKRHQTTLSFKILQIKHILPPFHIDFHGYSNFAQFKRQPHKQKNTIFQCQINPTKT